MLELSLIGDLNPDRETDVSLFGRVESRWEQTVCLNLPSTHLFNRIAGRQLLRFPDTCPHEGVKKKEAPTRSRVHQETDLN